VTDKPKHVPIYKYGNKAKADKAKAEVKKLIKQLTKEATP
jgi:hypothetical protein